MQHLSVSALAAIALTLSHTNAAAAAAAAGASDFDFHYGPVLDEPNVIQRFSHYDGYGYENGYESPRGAYIDSLEALNRTVHGRVYHNPPLELPCFSSYQGHAVQPNAQACAEVQKNYGSSHYRAERPNGYMNFQSSMCSSDPDDQCVLDDKNPLSPLPYTNRTCGQGDIPPHYLQITSPFDVQAAFSFARSTGHRIVIKNSGHDFLSRSSQKRALALWSRRLQRLEHHDMFVPEGCPIAGTGNGQRAITTGAGINFGEAYEFAHANNATIIGGYAETVGISGGFVQGAGHTILSPVYGLAIDRVLQFKVVTPDGIYRVANRCQNPDLFWALRGGGGGTFGFVMESTHMAEPAFSLVSADIRFASNETTLLEFLDILLEDALEWGEQGWGGHVSGSSIIHVNPILSLEEAKKSMKRVTDYALAHGGTSVIKRHDSFHSFYHEYIIPNVLSVGNTRFAGTRLIPRNVFASESGRARLHDWFKALIASGQSPYIPVTLPTIHRRDVANATSATPAWYSSLWEVGGEANWAWNSSLAERQKAIVNLNALEAKLEALAPGTGAYINEANPFTVDAQQSWWGRENYAALLAIKKRFDPDRILRCWRCVGWEDEDDNSSCFNALKTTRIKRGGEAEESPSRAKTSNKLMATCPTTGSGDAAGAGINPSMSPICFQDSSRRTPHVNVGGGRHWFSGS